MTLTDQQRGLLVEATRREYISARMFVGASKSWHTRYAWPTVTANSAQAAMRRLAKRGLLEPDEKNRAIFRITDAGRQAIKETT